MLEMFNRFEETNIQIPFSSFLGFYDIKPPVQPFILALINQSGQS